jgi:hypothetical protein
MNELPLLTLIVVNIKIDITKKYVKNLYTAHGYSCRGLGLLFRKIVSRHYVLLFEVF